jgi:hypothetical protein
VSQVVRVDQGAVAQVLASSPIPAMELVMTVRTNPIATVSGGIGPAGQLVQASKFVERAQLAMTGESIGKVTQALQRGGPAEKVRSIDLASTLAVILSQQQNNPDAKQVTTQLVEVLQGAMRDPSPAVQSWAGATLARIAGPAEKPTIVARLVSDPQWTTRLLGMVSMNAMKAEDQRAVLKRMVSDTDPIVAEFAQALDELIAAATANPTTQPSTQPLIGPATSPSLATPTTAPATPSPFGSQFGPLQIGPGSPLQPASRPAGPDVVIPALPLALPPSTQPSKR